LLSILDRRDGGKLSTVGPSVGLPLRNALIFERKEYEAGAFCDERHAVETGRNDR